MDKLKQTRQARGLSYRDLARRSGVSRAGIWKIEHDLHSPSLATLQKLAGALGVSVHELIPEERNLVLNSDQDREEVGS